MKRVILATLVVSVFFSGCASVQKTQKDHDLKANNFIAKTGKSSICIFQNKKYSSALRIDLLVDDIVIGKSELDDYILVDVEPGQHKISCKNNFAKNFMLTTKPNQIYFVIQETKFGFSSVRCKFNEVTSKEGMDVVNGFESDQNYL